MQAACSCVHWRVLAEPVWERGGPADGEGSRTVASMPHGCVFSAIRFIFYPRLFPIAIGSIPLRPTNSEPGLVAGFVVSGVTLFSGWPGRTFKSDITYCRTNNFYSGRLEQHAGTVGLHRGLDRDCAVPPSRRTKARTRRACGARSTSRQTFRSAWPLRGS